MKPRIPLAAALSARSLFDRQDLVTAVHMAAAIQFYLRRPDALAHSTRAALALLDQLSACARHGAAQKSAPGGGETPAGRVHNRAVGVA